MPYRPRIGLEVHAQLLTESKMFCGCPTAFGETGNTQCCPVCAGIPGTLPVANRKAIELVIKTGLALDCQVAERCRFARKNYFYPDMPKNYQISQYEEPLTFGGHIDVVLDGETARIRIRRVHLEEDTGKNFHLPDGTSLVEYNRAGVPLMEIVTEPDFTSPEQVRAYLTSLRELLRYLDVSNANMEEGAMRCEPTVDLVDDETGDHTERVEIKNLASIRGVYEALVYEVRRQRQCLAEGSPVRQETRRWSVEKQETQVMRSKESAEDYMYFPDPDLVPMAPSREWVDAIRATLPELPDRWRHRLTSEHHLSPGEADALTATRTAPFYQKVVDLGVPPKQASSLIMGPLTGEANEQGVSVYDLPVRPEDLRDLAEFERSTIGTASVAKAYLHIMATTGEPFHQVRAEHPMQRVGGIEELTPLVDQAIADNPKAVADYRAGKQKAKGRLVGEVMRATKGQADPALVNELIDRRLAGSR